MLWLALAAVVWSGPEVTLLGGPSRDGRYLSYVDSRTGELAVRELATGRNRLLTRKPPGSKQFAYFSAISPDARQVAYAWFNEEQFYELRVIGMEGGEPRVLYRNEEAGFVQPCAWSPDGKQILTLFFRKDNISQIALAPAGGGPIRVLRSLNWSYPKRMDFSPDGRSIVYDAPTEEGGRAVFVLAVDGSHEKRLAEGTFPLWGPRGVVYAREDGSLWMADRMIRTGLGRILPLGVTDAGELFYGVRSGASEVMVDGRRLAAGMAPAWSADGKALAYLVRAGTENFGQEARTIIVGERQVVARLAHIERVRPSPDGSLLLVSGSDGKGRAGLFLVGSTTRPLVAEHGAPFRGYEAVWAHDGRAVYYVKDGEVRRRELAGGDALAARGEHVAVSHERLAVSTGKAILVLPEGRVLPFEGATELEWGRDLVAARGTEVWTVPLDGAPPKQIETPRDRLPGFSVHPDGRLALAVGGTRSEVWSLKLP